MLRFKAFFFLFVLEAGGQADNATEDESFVRVDLDDCTRSRLPLDEYLGKTVMTEAPSKAKTGVKQPHLQ